MTVDYVVGLVVAVALLVYLAYAGSLDSWAGGFTSVSFCHVVPSSSLL